MPIEITLQGNAEQHREAPKLESILQEKADALFHALDLTDPEVSVVFTDDREIAQLNLQWREQNGPTDVLSFPLFADEPIPAQAHLGDIVISLEYAERSVSDGHHRDRLVQSSTVQDVDLTWTLAKEVTFLFIHGLLHLIGYDHQSDEDDRQMRGLEGELWNRLGLV